MGKKETMLQQTLDGKVLEQVLHRTSLRLKWTGDNFQVINDQICCQQHIYLHCQI